jgi:hypothetical protein
MKMKQLAVVCGLAVALLFSAGTVSAQNNGGGGGYGGGGNGGGGGGGGFGGGRGGRGGFNMDPAAMQQRMLDGVRDQLGFTNDTEWSAVEPFVQKDIEARLAATPANIQRMLFRGGRGGGNGGPGGQGGNRRGGGGGMFGGPANPEADALQKALDEEAPSGQVKDLLAKYETAQKAKVAKAKEAGEALRQLLTPKQEAQATLVGLLD